MDASRKGCFCFDPSTGAYIWEYYTPEENELFNAFEEGFDCTTINHRELYTEKLVAGAMAVLHPGCLITLQNDNTGAENLTKHSKYHSLKDEQVICFMGFVELILGVTFDGERVDTDKNLTD
jgi:hypothetical protein